MSYYQRPNPFAPNQGFVVPPVAVPNPTAPPQNDPLTKQLISASMKPQPDPRQEELKALRSEKSLVKEALDGRKAQLNMFMESDGAIFTDFEGKPSLSRDMDGNLVDNSDTFWELESLKNAPEQKKQEHGFYDKQRDYNLRLQKYQRLEREVADAESRYSQLQIDEGKIAEQMVGLTPQHELQARQETGINQPVAPEVYQPEQRTLASAMTPELARQLEANKTPSKSEKVYDSEILGPNDRTTPLKEGYRREVQGQPDGTAIVSDYPIQGTVADPEGFRQIATKKAAEKGFNPMYEGILELDSMKQAGITHIGDRPIDEMLEAFGGQETLDRAQVGQTVRKLADRMGEIDKELKTADDKKRTSLENERKVLEAMYDKRREVIDDIPLGERALNAVNSMAGSFVGGVADLSDWIATTAYQLERKFQDDEDWNWLLSNQSIADRMAGKTYTPVERDQMGMAKAARWLREKAEELAPTDPALQNEFWTTKVPQGVGSMAMFLGGGLATKSRFVAPMVLGGAVQGQQGYQEAIDAGVDEDTALKSYLLNTATGFSEVVPVERAIKLVKGLNKATGGRFLKMLKEGGIQAVEEFAQEWGQTTASNKWAQMLYDHDRDLFDGSVEAGEVGGVVGLLMGMATAALPGKQRGTTGKPTDDTKKPVEPPKDVAPEDQKLPEPPPLTDEERQRLNPDGTVKPEPETTRVRFSAPLQETEGGISDEAGEFLDEFIGQVSKTTSVQIEVVDEIEGDRAGRVTRDEQGNLKLEVARSHQFNQGDDVVETVFHETSHLVGLDQDTFIHEQWKKLTPEQRQASWKEYDPDTALEDADLIDNQEARQEWFAFQFARVARGESDQLIKEGMDKDFVDYLKDVFESVKSMVREWYSKSGSLTTEELDAKIADVLGYTQTGGVMESTQSEAQVSVVDGGSTTPTSSIPESTEVDVEEGPKQGEVGMKLGQGEKVLTLSGRETTPYPKIDLSTDRKAANTTKRVDRWLMQNALDEARSRGDEFNARQFEQNLKNPSPADRDSAEMYLFEQQPEVKPSTLKPLSPTVETAQKPKTPSEKEPTISDKPASEKEGDISLKEPETAKPAVSAQKPVSEDKPAPKTQKKAEEPVSKPTSGASQELLDEGKKAFEGLFAPAGKGKQQYSGQIPTDRVEAMTGLARKMVEQGLKDAPSMARFLDDISGGKARQFSNSFYGYMIAANPSLLDEDRPDWDAIYEEIDGEVDSATITDNVDIEETDTSNERTDSTNSIRGPSGEELGGSEPGSGSQNESGRDTEQAAATSEPEDSGSDQDGDTDRDRPGSGRGDGEGGISVLESGNIRIGRAAGIGQGGLVTKYRDNVRAIQTLKQIEEENRSPTPSEQQILAKYVGWGGLAQMAFDEKGRFYEETKELLSESEWASARSSVTNAHFTSPQVIEGIWGMLSKMGFTGGNILEPSMGVGHFFGFMPTEIESASSLFGVEKDTLTARIAKQIYQGATVYNRPFEKHVVADNSMDLVISNVPFSNRDKPHDPRYNHFKASLHDYFFLKGLDKVRPGGFFVGITSMFSMDKTAFDIRSELNNKANLVASFRLPNNAFKGNAATDVTTDLIILQKLGPGVDKKTVNWVSNSTFETRTGDKIKLNQYYLDNPDHMLGIMTSEGTMYGNDKNPALLSDGRNIEEALNDALKALPESIFVDRDNAEKIRQAQLMDSLTGEEVDNTYVLQDGNVRVYNDGQLAEPKKYISSGTASHKALVSYYEKGIIDIDEDGVLQAKKDFPEVKGRVLPKLHQQVLDGKVSGVRYSDEFVKKVTLPAGEQPKAGDEVLSLGENGRYTVKRPVEETVYDFEVPLSPLEQKRIKQLIPLRETLRDLLFKQMQEGTTDKELANLRGKLNLLYDAYVKTHGRLNDRITNQAFGRDNFYPLVTSLERYDEVKERYVKGDIFRVRTAEPRRELTSLSGTNEENLYELVAHIGHVDLEKQATLSGKTVSEIESDLVEKGLVFLDPESGLHVLREEYLSGQIYKKIEQAEIALQTDESFAKNIEELKKVVPTPVPADEIAFDIGPAWIDPSVYDAFLRDMAERDGLKSNEYQVSYTNGRYTVIKGSNQPSSESWSVKTDQGNVIANEAELMQAALNQQTKRIYWTDSDGNRHLDVENTNLAQKTIKRMRQEFRNYMVEKDEFAEKYSKRYNEIFNGLRERTYTAPYPEKNGVKYLPGQNKSIKLRPHQVDAVWRAVVDGKVGYFHEVGAGKTFAMIGAMMEFKRLGLANKPMWVVPNHLLRSGQMAADFYKLYPNAKILSVTAKDFSKKNRQKLISKIATGQWDAVLIGHSQVGLIPMSAANQAAYISEQLEELERTLEQARATLDESKKSRKTIKNLEGDLAAMRTRLEKLTDQSRTDKQITFEETGVDMFILDESHEFKNLNFWTKTNGVAGLGGGTPVQKTEQLKIKTDYILSRNNGRNLVFATGTPVTNTVAEIYLVMKYMSQDLLDDAGIKNFDEWLSTFGKIESVPIAAKTGQGLELSTRLTGFKNGPELVRQFRRYADIKLTKELKLPVPALKGGGPKNVVIKSNSIVKDFMDEILERAELLQGGNIDPSVDNWLKINTDARKVAIDPRLKDPDLPDRDDYKSSKVADNVYNIWKENAYRKGTQLVFSDLYQNIVKTPALDPFGNPKLNRKGEPKIESTIAFNLYEHIRKKLIRKGVPEEEIAIIHDFPKDEQKEKLFAAVNRGDVRILIGSTAKMGVGTNVQRRMVALHHIDATYRPDQMTQRTGRGVRQGNLFEDVARGLRGPKPRELMVGPKGILERFKFQVFQYATEKTLDTRMYQFNSMKARFVNELMSGNVDREFSDIGDSDIKSYEAMVAEASGDPRMVERFKLQFEVEDLIADKDAFERKQRRLLREQRQLTDSIRKDKELLPKADRIRDSFQEIEDVVNKSRKDAFERHKAELTGLHEIDEKAPFTITVSNYTKILGVKAARKKVTSQGGDPKTEKAINLSPEDALNLLKAIQSKFGEEQKDAEIRNITIANGLTGRLAYRQSPIDPEKRVAAFAFTGHSLNNFATEDGNVFFNHIENSLAEVITEQANKEITYKEIEFPGEVDGKEVSNKNEFIGAISTLMFKKGKDFSATLFGNDFSFSRYTRKGRGEDAADESGYTIRHEDTGFLVGWGIPLDSDAGDKVIRDVRSFLQFDIPTRSFIESRLEKDIAKSEANEKNIGGEFEREEELNEKALRLRELEEELGAVENNPVEEDDGDESGRERLRAPKYKGSEEVEAILKNTIGTLEKTPLERANAYLEKKKEAFGKSKQDVLDDLNALRDLAKGQWGEDADKISAIDNPWKFAHLIREMGEVFLSWLNYSTYRIDEKGDIVPIEGSKGLMQILAPLSRVKHPETGKTVNITELWEGYAAAKRAKRLWHEYNYKTLPSGRKVRTTRKEQNFKSEEDIDAVLEMAETFPILETVRQEYSEWNKALLDFAEGAGIIDPAARKIWAKADYVPFFRILEEEKEKRVQGPRSKDILKEKRYPKQLTGRDAKVSILENINTSLEYLLDESFKNLAKQKVVKLAVKDPDLMERVPKKAVPVATDRKELIEVLARQRFAQMQDTGEVGLDAKFKDFHDLIKQGNILLLGIDEAELDQRLNLWRMRKPVGDDIMTVMHEGKPTYYRVKDGELMRSILALGPSNVSASWGMFYKVLRLPKRAITQLITLDPGFFLVANLGRDTLSAFAQSDVNLIPGVDAAKGWWKALNKDNPLGVALRGAGAGGGTWHSVSPEKARKRMLKLTKQQRKSFNESVVDTPAKLSRFWQLFPVTPSRYMRLVNASENANRYAIAQKVLDQGGSNLDAAFAAKDLMNFTMHGGHKAMRFITETVPFLNARLQGLYKLGRASGLGRGKGIQKALLRKEFATKGAFITIGTIWLLARNWDDDRYWDLEEWDRDAYYHLFVGGQHFRFPKPFEVGAIFSTFWERVAGYFRDKDEGLLFQRFSAMLLETFAMNPTPQLVKPILEQGFNQNFFTGRPIVSLGDTFQAPEQQYNEFTSESFRNLAQVMPDASPEWVRSPKRLEAAWRAYTGTLGTYVMDVSDVLVQKAMDYPDKPARDWKDLPVMRSLVGRFVRSDDVRPTKYVSAFYDLYGEIYETKLKIKGLQTEGKMQEAAKVVEKNRELLRKDDAVTRTYQQLSSLRKQRASVYQNPRLSAAQKRELKNRFSQRQNQLVKRHFQDPRR